MNKLIFIVALLFSVAANSQVNQPAQPKQFIEGLSADVANYKDTTTGITYAKLYAGATVVNIAVTAQGYRVAFKVLFFADKASLMAGKKEVVQQQYMFAVKAYPLEADLKKAFLSLFK